MTTVVCSVAVGEIDRVLVPGGCDATDAPPAVRVVGNPPSTDPAAGVEIPAGRVRSGAVVLGGRPWVIASVTGPELGLLHFRSVDGNRTLRVLPETPMRVRRSS